MAVTATPQLGDSRLEVMAAEFDFILPRNYIYAQAPLSVVPAGGIIQGKGNGYSSLRIPSYHRLLPANSTRSEVTDIAPVQMLDSAVTVNPSLYGNAVQLSYKVQHESAIDVFQVAGKLVAENAAESVDYVARSVAVAGAAMEFGTGSARNSVSSAGKLTPSLLYNAAGYLQSAPKLDGGLNAPTIGMGLAAIMRNAIIADLAEHSSIVLLGQYRDAAPETVLMGEVGAHMSGIRLIVSDNAKIFHGAGSTLVISSGAIKNAVDAGATTLAVESSLSSAAAQSYMALGTVESTANGEQTNVETVYVNAATTAITVRGGAPNGGLIYSHSSGAALTGARQVHGVVVMGAKALIKVHDTDSGPNPILLNPLGGKDGLLEQFDSLSWRWFGGFARWAENRLFRLEVGSERQVLGI